MFKLIRRLIILAVAAIAGTTFYQRVVVVSNISNAVESQDQRKGLLNPSPPTHTGGIGDVGGVGRVGKIKKPSRQPGQTTSRQPGETGARHQNQIDFPER